MKTRVNALTLFCLTLAACTKPATEACTKPGDLTAIARDFKIASQHGSGSLTFPQIVEVLKKHGLEVK